MNFYGCNDGENGGFEIPFGLIYYIVLIRDTF